MSVQLFEPASHNDADLLAFSDEALFLLNQTVAGQSVESLRIIIRMLAAAVRVNNGESILISQTFYTLLTAGPDAAEIFLAAEALRHDVLDI